MNLVDKLKLAKKIREFEYSIHTLYKKGNIKGSTHLAIGQELPAVDIITQLEEGDIICTTHRNHAHYLALTQDFNGLRDELQGLSTGVNGGKALSQHIHVKDKFYANGIQGGMCPIACGIGLGFKLQKKDNIVVVFIGDGTLGQGVLYESLNIASLWRLPIVFIIENNRYAMSTPVDSVVAGSINARFHSFGLKHAVPWNVREYTPSFLVLDTYRHCGHSPRDNCNYRSREEEELWKRRDLLNML